MTGLRQLHATFGVIKKAKDRREEMSDSSSSNMIRLRSESTAAGDLGTLRPESVDGNIGLDGVQDHSGKARDQQGRGDPVARNVKGEQTRDILIDRNCPTRSPPNGCVAATRARFGPFQNMFLLLHQTLLQAPCLVQIRVNRPVICHQALHRSRMDW